MELTVGDWRLSLERTTATQTELQQRYDQIATNWDAGLQRIGYPAAYVDLFQRLDQANRLGQFSTGTCVLDAGIGTAALSLALWRACQRPFHLVGVDYSLGMLQTANQRLMAAGLQATLQQQDAQQLPFASASFDLVISGHLLEHLPDPQAGVAELVRVLRPGGVLVVVVTRAGLFDTWLQLRWRYRAIRPLAVAGWLTELQCDQIAVHQLAGGLLPSWFGVALSARVCG
jgi:demethylmenaquinone methyltransferase/2-methoxy-6-polyprenyl-1,4-benzoquinol methylase